MLEISLCASIRREWVSLVTSFIGEMGDVIALRHAVISLLIKNAPALDNDGLLVPNQF